MAIYKGDWKQDLGADLSCTHSTAPDPHGDYTANGIHEGVAKFEQDDGDFWIWWDEPFYYISPAAGVLVPGYWRLVEPGNAIGHYTAYGEYEGPVDVAWYKPTAHMTRTAHCVKLGGGKDCHRNRTKKVTKVSPKQSAMRYSMGWAARLWDERMNPADQAEWCANPKTFMNRRGNQVWNRPYLRFINVQVPLLYSGRNTIYAHTGRAAYIVGSLRLTVADPIAQELTTELNFSRVLPGPSYTCMHLFQVQPNNVDGPRIWAYTHQLGSYELETDKTFPDSETKVQVWTDIYELMMGTDAQVFGRFTYDDDPGGPPANWDVYTWNEYPPAIMVW